jgi:IS605 OrfB family transposase
MKDLTSKNGSDNKLEFETFEVGNDIVRFLQHFQVSKVFIEDLTRIRKSKSKPKGRGFNRLCINKWKREKLLRPINRVFGKNCIAINTAYTSTIGNVLNENLPDPIAASTAIANRGYNLIIIKSKKFYPELPETRYIEDRWKKTDVPSFRDWKELHSWLKETGLKYRVDVPEASMFRILRSKKSFVNVVDNFSYH